MTPILNVSPSDAAADASLVPVLAALSVPVVAALSDVLPVDALEPHPARADMATAAVNAKLNAFFINFPSYQT
jgi:hypothetical protein